MSSWTGSKAIPLDFEIISQQIHDKLAFYGINVLVGDQFCYPMLQQHFAKLGIYYRLHTFGSSTRAKMFGNLRQLIIQRKILIVDHPELLRQFRSLEEVRSSTGNIDVRAPSSCKDDLAVTVGLGALELSEPFTGGYDPVIRGIVEVVRTSGLSVGGYPTGTICARFPGCWDRGPCECYGC